MSVSDQVNTILLTIECPLWSASKTIHLLYKKAKCNNRCLITKECEVQKLNFYLQKFHV